MKQALKDINLITLPLAILLKDIANTNEELIHPEHFASRSKVIYRELLDGLQVYLFDDNLYMLNHYFEARDALKILLDRAEELATYHSQLIGKPDVSPYRAGQAMFVSSQLSDLIAFIQPDNLLKP
ncbi:hypothetical protein [Pedobacter africanus]|uniref:Uncharacterized protein n=1 Tax=Pedobacter africanus TaxID=151894 RepID=A0ACC6KUA8_9SPHI|nr:hypothetical protein [Pedobacter africanus]MDR6782703.1 hypothetical protein [Pedobacter africanus]